MNDVARESGGRPKGLGWVQIGVGIALLAVVIYFAQAPRQHSAGTLVAGELTKPEVRLIRPVPGTHAFTVSLTGEVTLKSPVPIVAELQGRVVELADGMHNGGSFAANETLVRIDPAEAELNLRMARAEVRAASARLREQQLKGELDAAIWEKQNPGQEAPAIVRREPQTEFRRGRLDRAEVVLDAAQHQMDLTRISFPFAGHVMASNVAVGQFVDPATPLGVVYEAGSLEVQVPVSREDLVSLRPLDERSTTVDTGRRTYAATVDRVSRALDAGTRQATLFLKFKDVATGEFPRPGTFVDVRASSEPYDNAILLPESTRQANDSVWVVRRGRLDQETPQPVNRGATEWIVVPFDVGDGIVLGTVPNARVGMEVDVVRE